MQFTGTIPAVMGDLHNLYFLDYSNNRSEQTCLPCCARNRQARGSQTVGRTIWLLMLAH